MNPRRLMPLLVLVAMVGAACDGNSTGPSSANNVSGSWDVTLVGTTGSLAGIMTLTDSAGIVNGSLQIANVSESLSGTVSVAGEMVLAYRDPTDGEQGLFRVQLDSTWRSFAGTFTLTSARGDQASGTIRGTKR
jgi:hypothetical protein